MLRHLLRDSALQIYGKTPNDKQTKNQSKVRESKRKTLQWFMYLQPIWEKQPWPEAFSAEDTVSADSAAFKLTSLKRADFSAGNNVNNLILIWLLSTSGFKKNGGKGQTPTRTGEGTFWKNTSNCWFYLHLIFSVSSEQIERHVRVNVINEILIQNIN